MMATIGDLNMLRHFTLEYWIDDRWYNGRIREVPGVFSQGETMDELEANSKVLKVFEKRLILVNRENNESFFPRSVQHILWVKDLSATGISRPAAHRHKKGHNLQSSHHKSKRATTN
jgi:predicted RNase H-like HicB family nuclease